MHYSALNRLKTLDLKFYAHAPQIHPLATWIPADDLFFQFPDLEQEGEDSGF